MNFDSVKGAKLAYHHIVPKSSTAPGILFLGGFRSDMSGTKAQFLREFANREHCELLCFDYFAHGQSEGSLEMATFSRWLDDATHMLFKMHQPSILIGSSMGGWVALHLARLYPERVARLVLIAPAPDFIEDLVWNALPESLQHTILSQGIALIQLPSFAEPYPLTWQFIQDARQHLLLRAPLVIDHRIDILHGMLDNVVPYQRSLQLMEVLTSTQVTLTLIKHGDHSLSRATDLQTLAQTIRMP